MSGVVGREKSCVVVGVSEKNGLSDHHPLNLGGMRDLLVVDLDFFKANEPHVRSLVEDALQHRNREEKGYAELKNERDALLEQVKTLRKLAKANRIEDRHICPEDILAITGE
jgi:hypothetical protein